MSKIEFEYVKDLITNHSPDKKRSYYSEKPYSEHDYEHTNYYCETSRKHFSIDLVITKSQKVPFSQILTENRYMYVFYVYSIVLFAVVVLGVSTEFMNAVFLGGALLVTMPFHLAIVCGLIVDAPGDYPTFKNNYKITHYYFPNIIQFNTRDSEEAKIVTEKTLQEAIINPLTSFSTTKIIKSIYDYKDHLPEKHHNALIIEQAMESLKSNMKQFEDKTLTNIREEAKQQLANERKIDEKFNNMLIESEKEILDSIYVAETIQDKNNKALYW